MESSQLISDFEETLRRLEIDDEVIKRLLSEGYNHMEDFINF
jgi:hypothetical protein